MKRSEMLRQIEEILNEDTEPMYTDVSLYTVANSILNLVERLGMTPPKYNDPVLLREEQKWQSE